MRKVLAVLPAVLIVLALGSANGFCAPTFGGAVYGAFNTYAMSDLNDSLRAFNDDPTFGTSFDEISSGFTGGIELRLWANPNWLITAGWEPIFAKSEDGTYGLEFDAKANDFSIGAAYFFPMASEKAKYGLGAGIDILSISGTFTGPGAPEFDIEGSGVGIHFMGLGEWTVSPGFAITAGAGYRLANVTDTKLAGFDMDTEFDYSGFIGRAGLAFYLPTK